MKFKRYHGSQVSVYGFMLIFLGVGTLSDTPVKWGLLPLFIGLLLLIFNFIFDKG